jgi:hypothetical protein
MLTLWRGRRELGATPARLGLTGLLPVRPPAGPAFGAIAGRGGGLTALLALNGRRLWLVDPTELESALDRLTAALAGPPVQLLLRRRRADLAGSLVGWQTLVRAGVGDLGRQAALERDYVGLALPRLRDGGLARVSAALAVSGDDPAALWGRVSRLLDLLPGGARALELAELAAWLRDWCGGDVDGAPPEPWQPATPDSVAPASLAFTADHLRLPHDRTIGFWRATKLPELVEIGWARHLLAEPALAGLEWDLSLHCRPVGDEPAERRATERALRAIELRLATLPALRRAPSRVGPRALANERDELARRLAALAAPGRQLREASLWLAIRGEGATAPTGEPLVAAFDRLGFGLAAVRGRLAVERAWRAIGPFNTPSTRPDEATDALLPAAELAPLAWLAVAPGQPPARWPVVTVSAERTALTDPALVESDEHLIATGDAPAEARAALQAWATTLAWSGARAVALHSGEEWTRLAAAIGGWALTLGPGGDRGHDPIAGHGYRLERRADWLAWLDESADFLGWLLPEVGVDGQGDLRAALVAIGLARLERGQPTSLASLREHLEASGYDALAAALDAALAGRRRWLAADDGPLAAAPGLTALGWRGDDLESWPVIAASLIRRVHREQFLQPPARRLPTALIVDGGAEALADAAVGAALVDIAQHGRAARLRLWLVAGPTAGLTRTLAGRLLLVNAAGRAAFREASVRPHDLEDAGWPAAVAPLIATLPPGAALLRGGGEAAVARTVIGEVIGGAFDAGEPAKE